MERSLEKVVSGSVYLAVDLLLTSGLGALFWIVAARIVPPEDVGLATTAMSFVTTLNVFATLGLPIAISKYVSEYNAQGKFGLSSSVFRFSVKIGLVVSCSASLMLLLLSNSISSTLYRNPALQSVMVLAAIAIPFQVLVSFLNGCYQGCQRMEFCLIGDMIVAASKFGAMLLLVLLLGFKALGIVSATSIGFILAASTGYFLLVPRGMPKSRDDGSLQGEKETYRGVLAFSLPNYVAGVVGTLSMQFGLMLLGIFSMPSVAFYNIAYLISALLLGLTGSVGAALLPTVSEQWTIGSKSAVSDLLNRVVRLSLAVSGPFLLGALLFPTEVLSLISPLYTLASSSLQVLTLGVFFGALALSAVSVLNGIGNAKSVMKVSLLSSLTTIVATALLVQAHGMVGAAAGVLTGYVVRIAAGMFFLDREGIVLKPKSILKPSCSMILSFSIGFLFHHFLGNFIIALAAVASVYLVSGTLVGAISWGEIVFLLKVTVGKAST